MTTTNPLPKLITFDGEARSGKGTIVHLLKDSLRDKHGYKVMLIDAGQVFRCLVVAATNRSVNLEDPAAIDTFLGNEKSVEECVGFVKAVYHMQKIDRDALLYTPQVGVDSAKIGARPLSQSFKDSLLDKWLRDARLEGYEIVLLDGRALEEVGSRLERDGLCDYKIGLYFVCDPLVGAMRTLGLADAEYDSLSDTEKRTADTLAAQIIERNRADRERPVQPIMPPADAPTFTLPIIARAIHRDVRFMATIDSSAPLSKMQMAAPIIELVVNFLKLTK